MTKTKNLPKATKENLPVNTEPDLSKNKTLKYYKLDSSGVDNINFTISSVIANPYARKALIDCINDCLVPVFHE